MALTSRARFLEVVTEAINDFLAHGFDSKQRLEQWMARIYEAAHSALIPEATLQRSLQSALAQVFKRTEKRLAVTHRGVSQFTLANIQPKLRAELDRRILASANLIRLNRNASIAKTLQRFAGWATSIPVGGPAEPDRAEAKKSIRKEITSLPFEERRVVIDQGHKLTAAINEIVAVDGGAIAFVWRHVMERGKGYQPRPEHVARNGKVYLLRHSWAREKGFVKPSSAGFSDEITQPAEEPFCRCGGKFLYALRDLPAGMLTAKGKAALLEARSILSGQKQ